MKKRVSASPLDGHSAPSTRKKKKAGSSSADATKPKRRPGRPRLYPDLAPEQVKELKQKQKADAIRKRLEEENSSTIDLKMASVEHIVGLPLPGVEPHAIEKNGRNAAEDWRTASLARRQELRDSIHQDTHLYIISVPQDRDDTVISRITWIKRITYPGDPLPPEPLRYDPSNVFEPLRKMETGLFRYYKIGPVILPVVSPHYVFNLTVERRRSDSKYTSAQWNDVKRALNELPRSVYMDTFSIDRERSFEVWPPTAGFLVRIMRRCDYESGALMQKHLLEGKLLDHRVKKIPLDRSGSAGRIQEARDRTPRVDSQTTIESFEQLEHLLFGYAREAHGFDPVDPRGETPLHVLYEQCVWLFREYFLGEAYFLAFRYFHALDLVGQTPGRIRAIIPDMLEEQHERPKRAASLILNKFLRPDRVGPKFRDGEALLRFINDHVNNEQVLELLLPEFAELAAFGAKRSAGKSSSLVTISPPRPGTLSGPLTRSDPPFVVRNPSSFDAIAAWYNNLRKLYADVVAGPFSITGDLFPASTVQPEHVEYMEFLIARGFVEVYRNLQDASAEQNVLEKHFDLQTRKDSLPVLAVRSPTASDGCRGESPEEAEPPGSRKKIDMSALVKRFLGMTEDLSALRISRGDTAVFASSTAYDFRGDGEEGDKEEIEWIPGGGGGGDDIFGRAVVLSDRLYGDVKPPKRNRRVPEQRYQHVDADQSLIAPSASGAREPLVIYPKVAAEMAQAVCENILGMITGRYEEHVKKNINSMVKNACRSAGQARLRVAREELSAEEIEFTESACSCLSEHDLYGKNGEIVIDEVTCVLAEHEPTKNFKSLIEILTAPNRGNGQGSNARYGDPFIGRLDRAREKSGVGDKFDRDVMLEALEYPVVMVDYPYSYAERKTLDRDLLDLACTMADYNIGPEELHLLPYFATDTLLLRRSTSENRFVVLKEVDKWPMQHLKEALQTLFFDWRGTGMARGTCILWIFADFSALDTGALSVLTHFAKDKPHMKRISLRQHLVAASAISELATRVQLREACQMGGEDIENFMVLCKTDEKSIDREWTHVDPDTGVSVSMVDSVPLVQLSLDTLHLYRDPEKRPRYAKVQLSSISNWRQLYTITCYATDFLLLVGTDRMLQHIYENSLEEFRVIHASDADPERIDVVELSVDGPDRKAAVRGYVRYLPGNVMDLWTSMRTTPSASSLEGKGTVVHL
jgi:hypothetical protein